MILLLCMVVVTVFVAVGTGVLKARNEVSNTEVS